jgi:hypothetical protein
MLLATNPGYMLPAAPAGCRARMGGNMPTPVVPNQFAVGKNKIVHKPTTATFSFDPGQTAFKSVDWGGADEKRSSGYRKDDIMRVAQQLLSKLPR